MMSSDHPNERRATYVKVELAEEDATLQGETYCNS